jgi:hypothetical protein
MPLDVGFSHVRAIYVTKRTDRFPKTCIAPIGRRGRSKTRQRQLLHPRQRWTIPTAAIGETQYGFYFF